MKKNVNICNYEIYFKIVKLKYRIDIKFYIRFDIEINIIFDFKFNIKNVKYKFFLIKKSQYSYIESTFSFVQLTL